MPHEFRSHDGFDKRLVECEIPSNVMKLVQGRDDTKPQNRVRLQEIFSKHPACWFRTDPEQYLRYLLPDLNGLVRIVEVIS